VRVKRMTIGKLHAQESPPKKIVRPRPVDFPDEESAMCYFSPRLVNARFTHSEGKAHVPYPS